MINNKKSIPSAKHVTHKRFKKFIKKSTISKNKYDYLQKSKKSSSIKNCTIAILNIKEGDKVAENPFLFPEPKSSNGNISSKNNNQFKHRRCKPININISTTKNTNSSQNKEEQNHSKEKNKALPSDSSEEDYAEECKGKSLYI